MRKHVLLATGAFLAFGIGVRAQDSVDVEKKVKEIESKIVVLEESSAAASGTMPKLKGTKISGYVQAQYRRGDTLVDPDGFSIGGFSGGTLPENTQQQMQLRRARLKVKYKGNLSEAVIQLDCAPKGVSIKDAYLKFYEPWIKTVGLQAGVFDRPFGFEIGYSSSRRESPERSRVIQSLFPKERDLGAALVVSPHPDMMPAALNVFNFKGGLFTGNGIKAESDNNLDFIGRFGVALPFTSINLAFDAGASLYYGAITARNDTAFEIENNDWTSTAGNAGDDFRRVYYGGDAQVYYDLPVIGGSSLRGEFVTGEQPSTAGSSKSPKSSDPFSDAVYQRKVRGYYAMYVQNLGPYLQTVVKYDSYDPNTELEGDEVDLVSDLSYTTLGLGLIYHWDANIKFVGYYDMVSNELSENAGAGSYDTNLSDDVFTFRIQYKF